MTGLTPFGEIAARIVASLPAPLPTATEVPLTPREEEDEHDPQDEEQFA